MQNFYPVFESGQVLTNAHLNQLSTWLNEQQRFTRTKLFGVGVVCGFDVIKDGRAIVMSKGAALTSAGFLMTQEQDLRLTKYRPYTLPISSQNSNDSAAEDASEETLIPTLLPESIDADSIKMFELLSDDFVPAPNEDAPSRLKVTDINNNIVVLLLEAQLVSLKNCQTNDCADKGARQEFVLRRLLMSTDDAMRLWSSETMQSDGLLPKDIEWQSLRAKLSPLSMLKLNLTQNNQESLEALSNQASDIINKTWSKLKTSLSISFDMWAYVLRSRFPSNEFSEDPWQDIDLSVNATAPNYTQLAQRLFLLDAMEDIIASYNEFFTAAMDFDAQCCVNQQRFAYHVMLGKAQSPDTASNDSEAIGPINFNIGAQGLGIRLRHDFVPTLPLQRQQHLSQNMQNLYYRTWLMCKRIALSGTSDKSIKISPSVENETLSNRAIPFYYSMSPNDDLHRNWAPLKTQSLHLSQVQGYALNNENPHPLSIVPNPHDFYRVEGMLSRPLAQVITEINNQKQALGLDFSVVPVLLPVTNPKSPKELEALFAALIKSDSLLRLYQCKLTDLDRLFLMLMGVIFQLLVTIIYMIDRASGQKPAPPTKPEVPTKPEETEKPTVEAPTVPKPSNRPSNNGPNLGLFGVSTVAANVTYKPMPNRILVNSIANEAELQGLLVSTDYSAITKHVSKTHAAPKHVELMYGQIRDNNAEVKEVINFLDSKDDPNGAASHMYTYVSEANTSDLRGIIKDYYVAEGFGIGSGEIEISDAQVEASYQSIRMLSHAENLMQQSTVSSIAKFDFSRFELDVKELQNAHDKIQEQGSKADKPNPMLASMAATMDTLNLLSSGAMMSSLRTQLKARLQAIFTEHNFADFKDKNPGLAHKCGVPKGGTLVLGYSPKKLLEGYQAPITEKLEAVFTPNDRLGDIRYTPPTDINFADDRIVYKRNDIGLLNAAKASNNGLVLGATPNNAMYIGASAWGSGINVEAIRANDYSNIRLANTNNLSAIYNLRPQQEEDPLNQMLVVADFCLWHRCCDDCDELSLYEDKPAPPPDIEQPIVKEFTVSGKVVSANRKDKGRLPINIRPIVNTIKDAEIRISNAKGKTVSHVMVKGAFNFTINPGEYVIQARAKGYANYSEEFTFDAPLKQDLFIEMTPSSNIGKDKDLNNTDEKPK